MKLQYKKPTITREAQGIQKRGRFRKEGAGEGWVNRER